jgi:hypothetical protein
MSTTTKDKPIISPLPPRISATVANITIKHFTESEAAELATGESIAYEGQETQYSFVSYVEPFAFLRKHLQNIKGIKRVCLTHEEYVIHVWILIEKEDWDIREKIYNAQYDIYLSESSAFRFNFHVSEERELSDCVPLFIS